jgi:Skp family chaperone for outer membrane proteins
MSFRRYLAAAALVFPVMAFGSCAMAAPLDGPPVAGVCLLSEGTVLGAAKVGVAMNTRLRQLAQDAVAPINAERLSIANDYKAVQAQKPADAQARIQALDRRALAVQANQRALERQIQLTQNKAELQIGQVQGPIVTQVFHDHACGLLINREVVIGGNLSNDLTPGVIQALDAKMTTITFDLEPLPAPKTAAQ